MIMRQKARLARCELNTDTRAYLIYHQQKRVNGLELHPQDHFGHALLFPIGAYFTYKRRQQPEAE